MAEEIRTIDKEIELKDAIKKRRLWLLINGIFLLVCIGLSTVIFLFISQSQSVKNSQALKDLSVKFGRIGGGDAEIIETKPQLVQRVIDGVFVEPGHENLQPFAVMIENHVDSRPSSALAKANVVYEAQAEGAITRFMAVYASGDNIEKIGPVRSARPYYIDWAEEYDAVYSHCGGSPEALTKIIQVDIYDMNEFYNASYFWRADSRPAPHNVYTSSQLLKEYVNKKGTSTPSYEAWLFKEDEVIENRPDRASTTIDFYGQPFLVEWVYDKNNNDYARYMGGEIHKDEDGSIIKTKNILIQTVSATVLDDELRLKMDTIGFGPAIACLDGQCREAIWKKNSASARTRFYYKQANGTDEVQNGSVLESEIRLNSGNTWVEIISPGIGVKY